MTYLEVECSYRGADSVRRFNDGRVRVLPCHVLRPEERAQDVAAQDEFESKVRKQYIKFKFQALSSMRFQRGFHRVNPHHPTRMGSILSLKVARSAWSTGAT